MVTNRLQCPGVGDRPGDGCGGGGGGARLAGIRRNFAVVLREGVETVLILSAVTLNTSELLSFLGTLLGVALAVLFGVTFVKGSVRVNLQKFFRVTTVILFFVAFQLLISGLHELSENGVLPSSRQEMALIGPIVRNDYFFFVTILALAAMMILFEYRRRQPAAATFDSPAQRRKAEWTARRERLGAGAVYASSFVFIATDFASSSTTIAPSFALAESACLRPSARTFLGSENSWLRLTGPIALPPPMKFGAERAPGRA